MTQGDLEARAREKAAGACIKLGLHWGAIPNPDCGDCAIITQALLSFAQEREAEIMEAERREQARLIDERDKARAEMEKLRDVVKLAGMTLNSNGSLAVETAKFNAIHRCEVHWKENWREQDLEVCVPCIIKENKTLRADLEKAQARLEVTLAAPRWI